MDSVGCLWLLMLGGFCFVDLLRLVQCGGSEAASTLLLDQCHVIWECLWSWGFSRLLMFPLLTNVLSPDPMWRWDGLF